MDYGPDDQADPHLRDVPMSQIMFAASGEALEVAIRTIGAGVPLSDDVVAAALVQLAGLADDPAAVLGAATEEMRSAVSRPRPRVDLVLHEGIDAPVVGIRWDRKP